MWLNAAPRKPLPDRCSRQGGTGIDGLRNADVRSNEGFRPLLGSWSDLLMFRHGDSAHLPDRVVVCSRSTKTSDGACARTFGVRSSSSMASIGCGTVSWTSSSRRSIAPVVLREVEPHRRHSLAGGLKPGLPLPVLPMRVRCACHEPSDSAFSMRLLIVSGIFHPEIGGPATYLHALSRTLAERGHQVGVVAYGDEHAPDAYPFPVWRVSRKGHRFLRLAASTLARSLPVWDAGRTLARVEGLPRVVRQRFRCAGASSVAP